MKERNKAVPAVYLIVQKHNAVLLLRRKGSGYYDGWYSLPSGHVEEGELPIAALLREAREEIGIEVDPKDLVFKSVLYRAKKDSTGERVDFFFTTNKWAGEPQICESDKCDDLQWFPLLQLPEKTINFVREVLLTSHGKEYSEWTKEML